MVHNDYAALPHKKGLPPGHAPVVRELVVPVLHMFAQLKEGYALGWFSAAWRTVVVSSLALVTLTVYFVGILLLGMLD